MEAVLVSDLGAEIESGIKECINRGVSLILNHIRSAQEDDYKEISEDDFKFISHISLVDISDKKKVKQLKKAGYRPATDREFFLMADIIRQTKNLDSIMYSFLFCSKQNNNQTIDVMSFSENNVDINFGIFLENLPEGKKNKRKLRVLIAR